MQTEDITPKHIEQAKAELKKKAKATNVTEQLKLKKINEEKIVQLLHTGPCNEAGETAQKLMQELESKGHKPHGKYREIYLNDARSVPPEKLKTICHLPFK